MGAMGRQGRFQGNPSKAPGVTWATIIVPSPALALSYFGGASGTMSAILSSSAIDFSLNGTAGQDAETRAIYEFRVFNMVILSLATCALTVTAVVCCVSYLSRWRQHKRAHVYESAVRRNQEAELADAKVTQNRRSFRNPLALLRRQDSARDNSRIYYIYSNPLPVGHPEDEPSTSQKRPTHTRLTLQDYASDPESGIVLDPPTFYMQL